MLLLNKLLFAWFNYFCGRLDVIDMYELLFFSTQVILTSNGIMNNMYMVYSYSVLRKVLAMRQITLE